MKTSARNQFTGTVSRIQQGAINAEIELALVTGQKIVAMVTKDSLARLHLQPGKEAIALVKASVVVLVTESDGMILSARNNLAGTVGELHAGAVNTEVTVNLPNGGTVVAIVTNQSVRSLGLQTGSPVSALFKASSVILGVAD